MFYKYYKKFFWIFMEGEFLNFVDLRGNSKVNMLKILKEFFDMVCEEFMLIWEGLCVLVLKVIFILCFVFFIFLLILLLDVGVIFLIKILVVFFIGLVFKIVIMYFDGDR